MTKSLPNIYLITDRHQIKPERQFFDVIEELLQAGIRMIQLREKDLSSAELYQLAIDLRALTNRYQCQLLINDRIDLALAVKADGVHLGHHSLPINIARQLLGTQALIGASTHSIDEVNQANQQGADFITYGPVFYTPSKAPYGKPVGIESLKQICTTSKIPVYALGGIKPQNSKAVIEAGANGIAMISALLATDYPQQNYQQLNEEVSAT